MTDAALHEKKSSKSRRSKKGSKASEANESFTCPVCEEVIKDATDEVEGQDSIFCVGTCATWIHRQCVALSVKAFQLLSKSDAESFLCPNCKLDSQRLEIEDLKCQVAALRSLVEEKVVLPPANIRIPLVLKQHV